MSKTYLTQADLTDKALETPHKFQRDKLVKLFATGNWEVKTIRTEGDVWVIVVRSCAMTQALIAPNGQLIRASKGKSLTWSWSRMRDLAAATVPAPEPLGA